MEKFFDQYVNKFVYKLRYPIIVISVIWYALAIWQTTLLKPLSEKEKFHDPEHPLYVLYTRMEEEFPHPPREK